MHVWLSFTWNAALHELPHLLPHLCKGSYHLGYLLLCLFTLAGNTRSPCRGLGQQVGICTHQYFGSRLSLVCMRCCILHGNQEQPGEARCWLVLSSTSVAAQGTFDCKQKATACGKGSPAARRYTFSFASVKQG